MNRAKSALGPVSQLPMSLANTAYLCHAEGRVLPFWAQQQMAPNSATFQSPLDSLHFGNTAYRSWTTLRTPQSTEHLIVDPVGMCSPNGSWSLDIWIMQDGQFFHLATLPNSHQSFETEEITVTGALTGVQLRVAISLSIDPTPAGHLSITLSEIDSPLSLFLAIRPYGVTGVFPIRDLTYLSDGAMMVNKQLGLVLSETPQNVLCLPFSEGDTSIHIGRWEQILKTTCPSECASGFVEYRISEKTAQLQAWLPLNNSLSLAQDLVKPLEQTQLKSWIQGFKNRKAPEPLKRQKDMPSSPFQNSITQQIHHLTQAQNTAPDSDPWGWWAPLGLLAWTPAQDPQYTSILQNSVNQITATFKKFPSPMTACLTLLIYQKSLLSGETPPADILQKAIKIATSTPLPQQELQTFQNEPRFLNCVRSLLRICDMRLRLSQDLASPRPGGEHPRKRGSATAHGATYLFSKALRTLIHFGMGITQTTHTNPLDHAFGKGPYWLTHFWALGILTMALPMTPEGKKKEALTIRKIALEDALETALTHWTYGQHLPPMLPIGQTRWQESGIVTSLLTVFPLMLIDAQDTRVSNTLLTLQNHCLHNDLLFSRAHAGGYPLVENLLLAMVYLLREDPRCRPILAWALQQVSPTGALSQSLHPTSHMGASGTGHHLAASGLFLTVFRHVLVHESSTGYQICQMLPATCWASPWTFASIPIAEGSLSMHYTPGEPAVLQIENHCPLPINVRCHPPEGCRLTDDISDTVLVLAPGEKRPFVFVQN